MQCRHTKHFCLMEKLFFFFFFSFAFNERTYVVDITPQHHTILSFLLHICSGHLQLSRLFLQYSVPRSAFRDFFCIRLHIWGIYPRSRAKLRPIFTALHICNAVFLTAKVSVRPSVCLSVRHMPELWQNERKFRRDSYTALKVNSCCFFGHIEWLVGDAPFTWNFGSNCPIQVEKRRFSLDIRS